MTCITNNSLPRQSSARRAVLLACSAILVLGMFAASAHADDHRGGDRRGGGPGFHGHPGYGGGYYRPPPVVYGGGPYYPPPPVVYGPGVGVNFPGVSINVP